MVALSGPVPGEVLHAVLQSANVTLVRPEPGEGEGLAAAAAALRRAGRATSPYALVTADPLAGVAAAWQAMWDVARPQGPDGFEREAAETLAAWRAGQFELPDYYLVVARPAGPGGPAQQSAGGPDFHLGPLRSLRPHRVAAVAAAEPAQQAAGALHELGSLRHGRWWPDLDEVIDTARRFYPDSLAEDTPVLASP